MVPIDTTGEVPTPLDISKNEVENALSQLNEVLGLYRDRALSVSKKVLTSADDFCVIQRYEKEPGTDTEKPFPSRVDIPIMKDEAGESYAVAADGTVYRIDQKRGISVISEDADGNSYGLFKDLKPWQKTNGPDSNFLPLTGLDGEKSSFLFTKEESGQKVTKPERIRAFIPKTDDQRREANPIRFLAKELKDNYDKSGVLESKVVKPS